MKIMYEKTHKTERVPLKTAVLFLIFNRLDTTQQVFEAIRQVRPPRLYIAADGPRGSRPAESRNTGVVRDYVMNRIDWPCDARTLFRERNLGCKQAVSGGIDWFFEHEEMGIILEDDCLPHSSFFGFCDQLLERYREDERIGTISGDNFQFGRQRTDHSYYFSRFPHIWGWATWRRAWRYYDRDIAVWPEFRDNGWLKSVVNDRGERGFWNNIFQAVYEGKIDTWDYQWVLASWTQRMVSVIPAVNLISNIGFGIEATHALHISAHAGLPVASLDFPLRHPELLLTHAEADTFTAGQMFKRKLFSGVIGKMKQFSAKKSRG